MDIYQLRPPPCRWPRCRRWRRSPDTMGLHSSYAHEPIGLHISHAHEPIGLHNSHARRLAGGHDAVDGGVHLI
eukprot:656314-Pyramimonas_sp.AAC.1